VLPWWLAFGKPLRCLAAAIVMALHEVAVDWERFAVAIGEILIPRLVRTRLGVAVLKVIHESAHALTCKRYGARSASRDRPSCSRRGILDSRLAAFSVSLQRILTAAAGNLPERDRSARHSHASRSSHRWQHFLLTCRHGQRHNADCSTSTASRD